MTRYFIWKVVSLMLLVSAVPLIAGVVIVDQLLKDTIALGLDQRVGHNLDQAVATYRSHIALRKQVMKLHAESLSKREDLAAFLGELPDSEPDIVDLLARESDRFSGKEQGIVSVTIAPVSSDANAKPSVILDRSDRYSTTDWRPRATSSLVTAADGSQWEMTITYAVPWALFWNYQELGDVRRLFDNLAERQSSLTEAYTRTYYVTAGVALLLTLVLALWLATRTTQRLGLLARATERVAGGDLLVAVPVNGRDEIAQLTVGFNTMVVELREARERLGYLERVSAWQEIARRLAHEIKNPLTPILLAVQQLDRKFDDLRTKPDRYRQLVSDAMEIVGEEVEGLRRLVVEFSEFARLPVVSPVPTDVGQFVGDVVRTNLQFGELVADFEPPPSELTADIDQAMMRRVLINLLQNAVDAVGEKGMEGSEPDGDSVCVLVSEREGNVRIEVVDKGGGVNREDLPRLFDPYFTTKAEGTGLGLSIVKKIVLEHGGNIAVESSVGDNTTTRFVIDLPVSEGGPSADA